MHPVVERAPDVVPGGMIASVPVTDAQADRLVPEELELAGMLSALRQPTFIAGRMALRAALEAVTALSPQHPSLRQPLRQPLLRTTRGGPMVPEGFTGSISHKDTRAIAVAAPTAGSRGPRHVGIDLEHRPLAVPHAGARSGRALAARILTPRELALVADGDETAQREAVLIRFALKEAVYKAIDPIVHRHVRFTEVEVDLDVSGAHAGYGEAEVSLQLSDAVMRDVVVRAAWTLDAQWIVAVAVSEAQASTSGV